MAAARRGLCRRCSRSGASANWFDASLAVFHSIRSVLIGSFLGRLIVVGQGESGGFFALRAGVVSGLIEQLGETDHGVEGRGFLGLVRRSQVVLVKLDSQLRLAVGAGQDRGSVIECDGSVVVV